MAKILAAVDGSNTDLAPLKRALLSVSDKSGLVDFATTLSTKFGVELISTGGTAKMLRDAGLQVQDVATMTGFPEMLDGRVKTLHPKVHGGLLHVRGNPSHEASCLEHGIPAIDLVVVNLYAFEAAVAKRDNTFDQCVENVDIGGPSMLRSAAKNHRSVAVASSPSHYSALLGELDKYQGRTSYAYRRRLAAEAYALTAKYDAAIASWFATQVDDSSSPAPALVSRSGSRGLALKYGCNPHQKPAALYGTIPFTVLNGAPGYINVLDAVNAYQLVRELRTATDLPAAASFKHVSPAGAALGVPLSPEERKVYEVTDDLTPLAVAYVRARQADPMSSFGDFVALSDPVDLATAMVLKREVSDGVIAPGFSSEALEILKAKKGGKFVCLAMDPSYDPADTLEYREVFGIGFTQRRNDRSFGIPDLQNVVTTKKSTIPPDKQRDLVLASITCKYTQSNSVAYAIDGQIVGVGAGQQSRVDCVKLAANKVKMWRARFHAAVVDLPFKPGTKRQDKVNARVRFIEGNFHTMTPDERTTFTGLFQELPKELPLDDRNAHLAQLNGVCLASDAFFPFRDNIDVANTVGVSYIAQAGGSVQDSTVIQACDQLDIAMAFTGIRLFHH